MRKHSENGTEIICRTGLWQHLFPAHAAITAFNELADLRIAFGGVILVQSRIIDGAIQTNETFAMFNGKPLCFCEDTYSRPFDAGAGNEIVDIICRNAGFVRPSFIALPENDSPDRQIVSGVSERIEIPVFVLLPIIRQGIEFELLAYVPLLYPMRIHPTDAFRIKGEDIF